MTAARSAVAEGRPVVIARRALRLFRDGQRALRRGEVDLARDLARGEQLDAQGRADGEALAGAAADHGHVLLVVLVEVAGHQLGADQTLAAVGEGDEDAERLHAGYFGVELLADELLHVGGDEQLVDVALAVICRLLAACGLMRSG